MVGSSFLLTDNGSVGRSFMNDIANMSSYVPYMVNAGNHEEGFKFAHYTEYFRSLPSNQVYRTVTTDHGEAPNNWFYSWNYGLVHFVTVAAEIYYNDYLSEMIEKQYDWLKADLEIANVSVCCRLVN